ncbi:DUF637 domain-containing protein [Pasteurella atlantica]|nr:DUF637 domain-containing protein [Pasteurella atlantica]MBR0573024.1 DUF637 domain-containing protein [Pasteurella atlantica]MDP8038849.1 DUF637 domain-containing protein [Pasteurella atlantica]MDP8041042.1 DUF637 domain-containing protein [Pasteurella atlantica]MDP8045264.1 DUF637 domain-containing protein [Pasteurella atlantica]MDP8180345.1 DUF637 domain-containing protein [Pasteurella atlantica]
MNKQCYRVIFNKARGMLMVVGEIAKNHSKSREHKQQNSKKIDNKIPSYSKLALAILCSQILTIQQVLATNTQINNTANNIPKNQRALLLKANNGTPIVNIRTPNSKGLSHNSYNQFNIGDNGVVLNNSIGGANTHLAGNIKGNQYLAKGTASTILNEVRSTSPSQLAGNIEIGGQKADVIIANPAGLQVNGLGFINANRATLTTGNAKILNGEIDTINVDKGKVSFNNNKNGYALGGKAEENANYVDVIAKAIEVNGKMNSKHSINLISGTNNVSYDLLTTTDKTNTEKQKSANIAIDVTALGGIYANSITLVGNENGVGVRNAGNISAGSRVVLNSSGKIENIGTIETSSKDTGYIGIEAKEIEHKGTINSYGMISSYGMIDIKAETDIVLEKGRIKSKQPEKNNHIRNNVYLNAGRNITINNKGGIVSNSDLLINANKNITMVNQGVAASKHITNIHSDNNLLLNNALVRGNNLYIDSGNNKNKSVTVIHNSIVKAKENMNIGSQGGVIIDNKDNKVIAKNIIIQGNKSAQIKNTKNIEVGNSFLLKGNKATVSNSHITAKNGIQVIGDKQQATLENSTLNSDNGAVVAISQKNNLNIDKVNINANSTILAADKDINVTNSDLKTDSTIINANKNINLDKVIINNKDSKSVGNINLSTQGETTITHSTMSSTGVIGINGVKNVTIADANLAHTPTNKGINADIIISSQKGTLHLKGISGKEGVGSEKVVNLTTIGDVNLSGKEVVIEGANISSHNKGTNITATDGSVKLKGVKSSFKDKVSQHKINALNEYIENMKPSTVYVPNGMESFIFVTYKSLNQISSELEQYKNHNSVNVSNLKNRFPILRFFNQVVNSSNFNFSKEQMILLEDYKKVFSLLTEKSNYSTLSKNEFDLLKNSLKNLPKPPNFERFTRYKLANNKYNNLKTDFENILNISKNTSTGEEHKEVNIKATNDVNIVTKEGGILLEGSDITSNKGGINIIADGNLATGETIRVTALADLYHRGDASNGKITGSNYMLHQLVNQAKLTANKDINIAGKGNKKLGGINNAVIINSANINAKDNVNIASITGDTLLESSQISFMDGSQHTSTSHSWLGLKKKRKTTTKTKENSYAITSNIKAKNINLKSDGDIRVYGSKFEANNNGKINISAGKGLYLYAIENRENSTEDVTKKSSFLGIRYNKDHTNDARDVIEQLPAKLIGEKAYTKSGHNTLLQGTIFETLKPADIKVGVGKYADKDAKLILQPIIKQITNVHTQEKSNIVWQKQVNSGNVTTTAQMPKFTHTPTITTANGIDITVPISISVKDNEAVKKQLLTQQELGKLAIELSKQPGYEYLKELDKKHKINWKQVELIQKNWNYKQEGLTGPAAAIIAIAVTVATGGAGAGIGASLLGTTTVLGSAVANAAFASLASQASISLINNKGDITRTLKDLGHSETVRGMATAALTAGIGEKLNITSIGDGFAGDLANGVATGVSNALVDAAINGTDLEDALKNSLRAALVNVVSAKVFTKVVKPIDADDFASNLAHKLVAGGVGCLSAKGNKQSCEAGALGAVVGEMVADYMVKPSQKYIVLKDGSVLSPLTDDEIKYIKNIGKLTAASIALLTNTDVNVASNSAELAIENNGLCGGACIAGIIAAGSYIFYSGDGDPIEGLEQIGKGDDPLSKAMAAGVSSAIELSAKYYPEKTKIVLDILEYADSAIDATITYLDENTGKHISTRWNEMPEKVRNRIKGGTSVVGIFIPAPSIKMLKNLRLKKIGKVDLDIVKNNMVCSGISCFVAGTPIHTINGIKPIEEIGIGELVWSREEFGDNYAYKPVIVTKATENQPIYAVKVKHNNGLEETFNTTEEHPFFIDGQGWRKASILESGMRMLDKEGKATATIISQEKLDKTDTVYNFEVQEFHTYHIGEIGLWVHNADCCKITEVGDKIKSNTPAEATISGYISGKKLNIFGNQIKKSELSPTQQNIIDDIIKNGDITGKKTEALTSSILKDANLKELAGSKYGGNKGFDHVVKDSNGNVTIILDSKQLKNGGASKVGTSKPGNQLSDAHIRETVRNLPDGPAKNAIEDALESGTLKTAVIGVDKRTGDIKFVPVVVPNKKP